MIVEKLDVGVIGLGKFGLELALTLSHLGHNVVGLDNDEERVKMAQDDLPTVYRGNATDPMVLKQLRFEDLDTVVVSVGDSMESSLLIVLGLQELNVRNIHVKANSLEYQKILNRLEGTACFPPILGRASPGSHLLPWIEGTLRPDLRLPKSDPCRARG